MGLTDFFRINLPYGIVKNNDGEWMAFNREYVPLGWNITDPTIQNINDGISFNDIPVKTKYKNVTEKLLAKLIDNNTSVDYDDKGKIKKIILYNDRTNPTNDKEYWDRYVDKIKILSQLKTCF